MPKFMLEKYFSEERREEESGRGLELVPIDYLDDVINRLWPGTIVEQHRAIDNSHEGAEA